MNKFDHILAKKLKKYASPVNDDIWSNIEQELFPPKRNPYGWYALAGIFALVLLFGVGWQFSSQDHTSEIVTDTHTIESTPTPIVPPTKSNTVTQTSTTTAEAIPNSTSTDTQIMTPRGKETKSNSQAINTIQVIDNHNVLRPLGANKTTISASHTAQNKIQSSSISNTLTSRQESKVDISGPLNSTVGKDSYAAEMKNTEAVDIKKSALGSASTNGSSSSRYNTTYGYTGALDVSSANRQTFNLSILPLLQLQVESQTFIPIQPKINLPKVDNVMAMSVDVFGGIDLPMQTLEAVNEESNLSLFARQNTEVNYTSWNTGVRFSLYPTRKFALRTGLVFNQYNVKFNYVDLDATQEEILVLGQDSLVYTVSGQREIQHLNHYRSYSIPIQLGITSYTGRFNISFNPGILLNLSSSVIGRGLDDDNHAFEIDNDTDYKSNFGISFFGSIGLGYALSTNLDFYVEPNLRYNMSSITTSEATVNERFTSIGLLWGFRYHL